MNPPAYIRNRNGREWVLFGHHAPAGREQRHYELIRPLVLFGDPVAGRAEETGTSEGTLYRRTSAFDLGAMESPFGSQTARRRRLPPAMRHLVVNLSEIPRICYVRFGRRPDERTVRRMIEEEPVPLRMIRRFPPYREIPEARQRRAAVVTLHDEGWTVKAIAAYVALKRWIDEGEAGWLRALRLGEYAARDLAGSAVCSPWRTLGMPAATLATVCRSAARGCP